MQDGNTALHIAVNNENVVIVENLIKNGAHIDIPNQVSNSIIGSGVLL